MFLTNYECMTSAGLGTHALMAGLYAGLDHSTTLPDGKVCFATKNIKLTDRSFANDIEQSVESVWQNIYNTFSIEQKTDLQKSKTLLILSSTKGALEDYIWSYNQLSELQKQQQDPYKKIIEFFKIKYASNFHSLETLVISNACASSHVAFSVAYDYLNAAQPLFDKVIVLATDFIGAFIYKGFLSLKVLSTTKNKSFAEDRDGLQLGEALAICVFTSQKTKSSDLKISAVVTETEAGSVTRPSTNGESLFRVMQKMDQQTPLNPDFILAHATGTKFNDQSEESALSKFTELKKIYPPVTGIKWSIGHTLGASGALDLIAASEIIQRQQIFKIHNTDTLDKDFSMNILNQKTTPEKLQQLNQNLNSALVTSLGFGGIHAGLYLERTSTLEQP